MGRARIPCVPEDDQTADLRPVTGDDADAELAGFAKALAHPARVRILRLLAQRKTCVCGELVGELDLAQSTVSQHLKILKEAGLVQGQIDGPRVCYCVSPRKLRRFKALARGL
ncbi:MAG TPA: metalloregulator ArsR/SmtB family transcription factor [Myxococcales bacterium LLY-WYZ-16_1]|nr:metalloregulator ArsR/SmtB family transcription factor [Myxococcales bacterium LLY-WYZ-16_1]